MTETRSSYSSVAEFAPDWISTPGDSILEALEERGWSQAEFAQRMDYSRKHINLLLKAKVSITDETAVKLSSVLGSTPRFWLNLEAQYRDHLAQREEEKNLKPYLPWLKKLPLKDMVKFEWVKQTHSKCQQVAECLRYFGVASVDAWQDLYEKPVAAYRANSKLTRNPAAVSAWLRMGERTAESMRMEDYNAQAFEAALSEIRSLTMKSAPAEFVPELKRLCAAAGVAVVLAPAPKGCPVSGAAKWLSPDCGLIMLSLRGKTDDTLWFSFFHEAGHLLKHRKKLTFLDILGEDGLDEKEEAQANAFARDHLISPKDHQRLLELKPYTMEKIRAFAHQIQVAPGIVLGRLQFDKHIPWTKFNALKVRYRWSHEAESRR
jgi:HTH-type transcriptional regulator / antitoxin HigA